MILFALEIWTYPNLFRADTGAYYLALRLVSSKPLQYWLKTDFKQQPKGIYIMLLYLELDNIMKMFSLGPLVCVGNQK